MLLKYEYVTLLPRLLRNHYAVVDDAVAVHWRGTYPAG